MSIFYLGGEKMSNKRIGIILDVDAEVSKAKGNIGSLSKVFEGIGGK
jgi:hypothetical protein